MCLYSSIHSSILVVCFRLLALWSHAQAQIHSILRRAEIDTGTLQKMSLVLCLLIQNNSGMKPYCLQPLREGSPVRTPWRVAFVLE